MKMMKQLMPLILIGVLCTCIYFLGKQVGMFTTEVSYTEFTQVYKNTPITEATIEGSTLTFKTPHSMQIFETVLPSDMMSGVASTLQNNGAHISLSEPSSGAGIGTMIMISIIPVLLLIGAMFYIARKQMGGSGSAIAGMGKSKGTWVNADDNPTRMSDVAILDNEYKEILQLVDFLKDPDKVTAAGGRLPKGFLMSGPPGVGKTLIARAIAGESHVNFYEVSGAAFDEMLVGAGASRVRDMFEEAKKKAPCIVFIDEIDAVANSRDGMSGKDSGQTVGQLLTEMDGFSNRDGVVIIAATNRPDRLDNALLRPGRFDRHINISLPDLAGREKILEVHAEKVNAGYDIDIGAIARGTTYFSGADLANLVNEAALLAGNDGRDTVMHDDLEQARDTIIMGSENEKVMPEEERKLTAYHEAGHAIVGHAMPEHDPLYKVSIIPRGHALGVTAYLPEEDRYSQNLDRLESSICSLFGGRIAEEMIFGENKVTTGASNDLERATALCRKMVHSWGFSELGMMNIDGESSEHTKRRADEEVQRILKRNYDRAKECLEKNTDTLHVFAERLLEQETLDADDIKGILGSN